VHQNRLQLVHLLVFIAVKIPHCSGSHIHVPRWQLSPSVRCWSLPIVVQFQRHGSCSCRKHIWW